MRRLIRLSVATAIGLTGAGAFFAAAAPAMAVSCPDSFYWSAAGQGFVWRHLNGSSADVAGLRSGVKWTGDGALCDFKSSQPAGQSVWIGVQGYNPSTGYPVSLHLVQAGLIDGWTSGGNVVYCRFWTDQAHSLVAQVYDCNTNSPQHPVNVTAGDSVNFDIHTVNNGNNYETDDCGVNTSGYGSCSTLSTAQAVWDWPEGTAFSEEDYGANNPDCDQHAYGASSNQEKIGDPTGLLPLQGSLVATPNTWNARSWGTTYAVQPNGDPANPCNDPPMHYYLKESNPTRGLDFYDTRNSG